MILLPPTIEAKKILNSQRENVLSTIKTYTQAVNLLPEYCKSKKFMDNISHSDNIPGNNQDLALVLIQSLSLDIEEMINSIIVNDPNIALKVKGIIFAAKAHDSFLEGLKMEEKFFESSIGIPDIK